MNAITLFAGAGGADLGMQRAGVKHLACVEGDAIACATLAAAGFPAVHAWIGTPPPGSGLTGWRWDGGPVDLLWASPPCQPYSRAGKQLGVADPRDGLFLALGRRRADIAECAALVGFPADYPFQGTSEARYRQIGNAVAPVMAEALVRSIPR